MSDKLNFVFFGTPDVASETLEILKQAGFLPSLIVTSPDRRAGRKMIITSPPAKLWAIENNIPYIQPENLEGLNNTFMTSSQADAPRKAIHQQVNMRENKSVVQPDIFIVVAYGKIIPKNILAIPKLGSINIHYSLLPKYRGASPVESAILNGESFTGVTIQKMVYKMDAGSIIAQEKIEINSDEKSPDLRKRLIKIGGELLVKTLPEFISGKITPIPQNEKEVIHCKKIKKEDGLIDLNDEGVTNYNKFRAYAAWPRTFFFKDGKRIIITKARLDNSHFVIEKIIPENGKEMDYKNQ